MMAEPDQANFDAELPRPVREAIDAVNAGDTDAFLAAFAPADAVVNDWGQVHRGGDEIRRWSDERFIGQHVSIRIVFAYTTVDGEVVALAQIGGDQFTGPCTYTFRIEDGALAQMCVIA